MKSNNIPLLTGIDTKCHLMVNFYCQPPRMAIPCSGKTDGCQLTFSVIKSVVIHRNLSVLGNDEGMKNKEPFTSKPKELI